MTKNIVIFSDGTGQRGGVLVDERRSNIYKLFRATRCGPESAVSPAEQLTHYDPGIGTLPPGMGFLGTIGRWIYNLVSQALGIGLTKNIIECYAAVIRMYRPGDRIFLFGFSRGAYTVRCLGAVISLCGVPQKGKGDSPLKLNEGTSLNIATEAVKKVYQHTSSWIVDDKTTERQKELLAQRSELARRFRADYGSAKGNESNAYPHFIGVFDTVASLSNPRALAALIALGAFVLGVLGTAAWWFLAPDRTAVAWLWVTSGLVGGAILGGFLLNLGMRFKSELGLPRKYKLRFFHLAKPRMKFYDKQLSSKVGYARHAISIDEARTSFARVEWGEPNVWRNTGADENGRPNPQWFEQLWFAGNHSDIGGSYPENESRLSDITLEWMVNAARSVGLKYDPSALRLYPDPAGPQHDETKSSRVFSRTAKMRRFIKPVAPLHPSVIERFRAGKVLHYDVLQEYRPLNLQGHELTGEFEFPRDAAQ